MNKICVPVRQLLSSSSLACHSQFANTSFEFSTLLVLSAILPEAQLATIQTSSTS